MQTFKYRIIACMVMLLILCTVNAQNANEKPIGQSITKKEWNDYKHSKSELAKKRSTYQVVKVKVLPPINFLIISDEELMGFLTGKYLICCDAKREIYITDDVLDNVDFKIKEQVFEHYYGKAEEIERRRVKEVIPERPDENAATEEEIESYNKAINTHKMCRELVKEQLSFIEKELGEPWYSIAITRINRIARKSK